MIGLARGLDVKLTNHIAREELMLSEAFPAGDLAGHRKAHEAMIHAANEQAKFWGDLRLDLAKKSIWGVVLLVIRLIAVGGLTMVVGKLGLAAHGVGQ